MNNKDHQPYAQLLNVHILFYETPIFIHKPHNMNPSHEQHPIAGLALVQLSYLPEELLLQILNHLDIPDLLSLSRTSHHLRTLSFDPLLHLYRLRRASLTIGTYIPTRPPLAQLLIQRIYITRTTFAARNLGHSLIKIKLNRKLGRRPTPEALVEMGLLPGECYGNGGRVAPGLVETKRRVERERVKDVLRGWVARWSEMGRRADAEVEELKPDVRRLARRFGRDGKEKGGVARWGRSVGEQKGRREDPTRAKVLGLRKFWEGIGQEAGAL